MTDISTVSGTSGMFSMTAGSISSLEDNYDLFLSVLTAQIQNQNPLDPTDASEMTNQLVNYSQVEQQILTNDFLQNLVLSTNNESAAVAIGMVGMEVTYNGEDLDFESGDTLDWSFDVPEDCDSLVAQVVNENGDVVYSEDLSTASGDQSFSWDGTLSNGGTASDGTYSLQFVAKDSSGGELEINVECTSTVTMVDWSSGTPKLVMENGQIVSLSDVVTAGQNKAS
jgi:flagellar basal-body rod modification protein FlgD